MALLEILQFPDERLRTQAQTVTEVTDQTRKIISDMFETMYHAQGIGLAATQVDIHQRIVVMDLSSNQDEPIVLINPEITERAGIKTYEEGCLSFPGVYASVERAQQVTIQALNAQGESFDLEAEDLLAICIQHELDHLQGKLFVDYLTPLKRQRIKQKLEKQQRLATKRT